MILIDLGLTLVTLTIIITSMVALRVLIRNPFDSLVRSYVLLISFFILWAVVRLLVYLTTDTNFAVLLERIAYILGLCIAWSFLYFSTRYPYKTVRLNYAVLIVFAFLTAVNAFNIVTTPGLIMGVEGGMTDINFDVNLYLLTLYNVTFMLFFCFSYYLLLGKYFLSSGDARRKLKYVILSTSLAVAGGLVFNLLFPYIPNFRYQIFGPSFTLFFTLTVGYLMRTR